MSDVPEVPEIDVHQARQRVSQGDLLLDVREPHEHEAVRIAGGQLLPLSQFAERYAAELPQDRPIVVYCRSGRRSAHITDLLLKHGYRAINMAGGILAWQDAALPVETDTETGSEANEPTNR